MTKRPLVQAVWLLAMLFAINIAGGTQFAAAGDSRFGFADKQASIVLAPGVTMQTPGGLPPESELLYAKRGERRILGIYAGNQPDTSVAKNESPSKETIGGYPALTYLASNDHGRSRQTFVQVKDEGWPNVIHFFYSGISVEEAAIADKMIESLQITGAAAQK